ncbi:hypothetical protein L0B53_03050 [Vibrio sp. SS-MA-C1-2]|uniref:hypothetical protein n=1 Tax=Vibrio sp. SS-MA-C1-2 TaxID=2908646 RepID=UPI001F16184C|nr:hypothetical protein [Vibrio sp. SS-MA-C1-2]UJF16934.1 hypothetical protein L0B53_03050 [Vibrio sp. SS-MA-C1-2]
MFNQQCTTITRSILFCFSFLFFLSSSLVIADEQTTSTTKATVTAAVINTDDPVEQPSTSPALETTMDWIDDKQQLISQGVTSSASSLDRFIASSELEDDIENLSYFQIKVAQRFEHHESPSYISSFKLRLSLPNTKKRFKLVLDSDPDDFKSPESQQRDYDLGSSNIDDKQDNATAALRFYGRESLRWKSSFDVGVKFKLPVNPFARVRVSRFHELNDNLVSQVKQRFFYYDQDGFGSKTEFNLFFKNQTESFWTATAQAQFLDDENIWELYEGISYYQRPSDRYLIQYNLGFSQQSRPSFSPTDYWVSAEFYYRVYKKWLYLKVIPEITFPEKNNYDITPAITFQFDLFFTKQTRGDRLHRAAPKK